MEDKFGFLMKAEAEEHLIELLREHKEACDWSSDFWELMVKVFDIQKIQKNCLRTWGGSPEGDIFKIR